MMSRWSKLSALLLLFLMWATLACTASTEDEDESGITLQRLEDADEERAWALYKWYITQGWAPCDPPPDPWHPFVQYGYCSADDAIEHEIVPNASYDE